MAGGGGRPPWGWQGGWSSPSCPLLRTAWSLLKRVRLWGRVSLISGPCSPHPWVKVGLVAPPLYPWPLSPLDSGPLTFPKKDPEVELPAQAGQHRGAGGGQGTLSGFPWVALKDGLTGNCGVCFFFLMS